MTERETTTPRERALRRGAVRFVLDQLARLRGIAAAAVTDWPQYDGRPRARDDVHNYRQRRMSMHIGAAVEHLEDASLELHRAAEWATELPVLGVRMTREQHARLKVEREAQAARARDLEPGYVALRLAFVNLRREQRRARQQQGGEHGPEDDATGAGDAPSA